MSIKSIMAALIGAFSGDTMSAVDTVDTEAGELKPMSRTLAYTDKETGPAKVLYNHCLTVNYKYPTFCGNAFIVREFTRGGGMWFPTCLTHIENGAYLYASAGSDGNLTLPVGVRSIGARAFKTTPGLIGTVSIPSTVSVVPDYMICVKAGDDMKCAVKWVDYDPDAFWDACAKNNYTVPELHEGLEYIGDCAFTHGTVEGDLPKTLNYLGREVSHSSTVIPSSLGHDCYSPSNYAGVVTVEHGVTALYGAYAATAINLPDTIIELNNFSVSGTLNNFNQDRLISIVGNTFENHIGVDTLTLNKHCVVDAKEPKHPDDLVHLTISNNSQGIWAGCPNLEDVVLRDDVSVIREGQFRDNPKLTRITGDVDLLAVEDYAFQGTPLTEFPSITSKCLYIGDEAFAGTHVKEITGDYSGVKYQGYKAFYHCTELERAQIPNNVPLLAAETYSGCVKLNHVSGSDKLRVISERAFSGCVSLSSIPECPNLEFIGDEAFINSGVGGDIQLGCVVGSHAFYGCAGLTSLTSSGKHIGPNAFEQCENLSSVVITGDGLSVNRYAFKDCVNLETVSVECNMKVIARNAFSGCVNLKEFRCPGSVMSIGTSAFEGCSALTSVDLANVEYIYARAFVGVGIQGKLVIPAGVKAIGHEAFAGCLGITEVEIEDSKNTKIADDAFAGCSNLTKVITNGVGADMLVGAPYIGDADPSAVELQVNVPYYIDENDVLKFQEGVTEIPSDLFRACKDTRPFSSIDFTGITKIASKAFWGAKFSGVLTLPESVEVVEDFAFAGCSNLTEVVLTNPDTTVAENAFYLCNRLSASTI